MGRAIDTVKKAIENDNEGEYEKAYQMYYSALELFMLALKWEKNPKSKEMIRAKAGEYMDRAEKLKNHLAEDKKKPSAVGANGKVAQGSGKGGYVFDLFCLGLALFCPFNSCLLARQTSELYTCVHPLTVAVQIERKMTITAKMQNRKSSGQHFKALSCLTSQM